MASFSFSKKQLKPLFLSLAVLLVAAGSYFRIFELYELQTYDWRCQIRGPRPVSDRIVLIDIWNDALKELGAWPFDREYHSNLIQILHQYGAKAVVFDVLFADPREHDDKVIEAAKEADNTYFAFAFADPKLEHGVFTATRLESDLVPGYREAARGVGFVNTRADMDGKRRRALPVIEFEGKQYTQLAFRAAADVVGGGPDKIRFVPGKYIEISPELRAPLDDDSCFVISYAGPWEKTFHHYSYLDVVYSYLQVTEGEKPRIDLDSLKGKICVIGLTSQGSHDISPIPIQSVYPMVGSYANILNDLLEKDFVYRAGRWVNLLCLLFFSALVAWISIHQRPVRALLSTLAAMAAFIGIGLAVFFWHGVWIDLFYPTVIFALVYAGTTLYRMLSEMRKRQLIESELKIASQIQKSFLPQSMPEVKGISIAVHFRPAKAVGGDLYTFVKLSEDGKIGVMAGDVSGKGTPAALFMAKTVSEFKFSARDRLDPAQALEQVNNAISSESTGGLFVTMSYAIFDIKERKLLLSNGGHLPVVLASADGSSELLSAEEGMPIGVMEGVPFMSLERTLKDGDVFAFYSDGVSEARNRKKEEYGIERLQKMLALHHGGTAAEILEKTIEDLDDFMGKAEQHDDITLILVKMEPVAG